MTSKFFKIIFYHLVSGLSYAPDSGFGFFCVGIGEPVSASQRQTAPAGQGRQPNQRAGLPGGLLAGQCPVDSDSDSKRKEFGWETPDKRSLALLLAVAYLGGFGG